MMVNRMNTKRILIFLGFAFGIPWGAALLIYLSSAMGDNPVKALTLVNYIFISTPALAHIATRLITGEGWGQLWLRPNLRRGWRFYLAAWLLPLFASLVGGAIFYLLYPQSFDPTLGELKKLVASSPALAAINPWMLLLIIGLQAVIVGLTINGLASIGEEFGWRAYLLPKLMERFTGNELASGSVEDSAGAGLFAAGASKASLLIGLVWGVWHWPLMIMAASIDPGQHILTPLVYLISTCSFSVLLCWVTLRSSSVWPAAIGHGTINATSGLAGYLLKGQAMPLLGPGSTGLIGVLGFLAMALVLLLHRRAFARGKAAGLETVQAEIVANRG
jgi:membrane protease YdiL (CAAX protease family)